MEICRCKSTAFFPNVKAFCPSPPTFFAFHAYKFGENAYFCSVNAFLYPMKYTSSYINVRVRNLVFLVLPLLLGIGVGTFCSCSKSASGRPDSQTFDALIDTLDVAIAHYDRYAQQQENRIFELRRQLVQKHQPTDRYALQSLLYDAYHVYNADSALAICNRQIAIAEDMNNRDWQDEWRVKRSFILAATGLLEDALVELRPLDAHSHLLPLDIRTEYFRQKIYIYSHMQQYVGNAANVNSQALAKNETADSQQQLYNDSILLIVPKTDPLYLWQMAWGPNGEEIRPQLEKALAEGKLNSRYDAMNAYSLAHIYDLEGNDNERMKALVKSAIADVRCCNHDVASLEELARILYERGDLTRSYTYINYCLGRDLAFHNRVRIVTTGEIFSQIHQASIKRQRTQRQWIAVGLALLAALALLLALVIIQLVIRVRRSRRSEKALAEANHHQELANTELQSVNAQLQKAMADADRANAELTDQRQRLSEAVSDLRESNYIKEETVGLAFTLCSKYISHIDEERTTLARLLKTNRHELLRKHLDTPQSSAMLKDFFRHFDELFLNIYPSFVDDFNALLRPDERITPRDPKGLNTELRIYALVRLGINDSVKIAEFLHCSPQTVYNNRLRVRNKSDIPNSDFAAAVQHLGKART